MKRKNRWTSFLLFGLVLILILFFSSGCLADRKVSFTVTINIEEFQQLTLISKSDHVSVSGNGDEAVSEVTLNTVSSSPVILNQAVSAKIKSNVEWELLAHTENGYINGNRSDLSEPSVALRIEETPRGVENFSENWLLINQGTGGTGTNIAKGPRGNYGPFDIAYKLGFGGANPNNIDEAGVDVVYTIMQI